MENFRLRRERSRTIVEAVLEDRQKNYADFPSPFIPLREGDSGRGRILNIKFKVKDKL